VSGEIAYDDENSLLSPAPNVTSDDDMIVSSPQLEVDEITTVYLIFEVEQFVTLPKTPTVEPADIVEYVVVGVVTVAQAVPPVEPPPPLPLL